MPDPLPDPSRLKRPRTIRSFVRRTGRITPAQERALERLWPRYGIGYSAATLALDGVFGRSAERVLEIGFGDGEALVRQAADDPERDYLGVEVHRPGIGHCLLQAERASLGNLRLIAHDASDVLQQQIADRALHRINIYFPDPWPKKRHHKRRLLQPELLSLIANKLLRGGVLCVATDWPDYAAQIDEIVAASDDFSVAARRAHDGDRPLDRPPTRFERRGIDLGHEIVDWQLVRS